MPSYFSGSSWYKGALHCHTSVSDGKVQPLELLRRYRERGYSFAAVTDHDFLGHYPEAESHDFITLPGAEIIFEVSDFKDNIRGTHIVALARDPSSEYGEPGRRIDYRRDTDRAALNGYLGQRSQGGNSLIFAHPYWSYFDFEDAAAVEHCFAMELYNGVAHAMGLGESLAYWDYMLRRGKRMLGVACDDHHAIGGDFDAGWVCVKADALSRGSIFENLHAGNYYSSTGPAIVDFGVDGGKVYLRSEPARAIRFVAFGRDCEPDLTQLGTDKPVEYGEYALTGRESYVRAEVEGLDLRRAWTNPIFF